MLKTVGNPSTRNGDQTIIDGSLIFQTVGEGVKYPTTLGGSALPPAFSAYKSTNQAIVAFTPTQIAFEIEEFDTNSNYNTTTYRFTPTVAGYYQVNWSILLNDSLNSYFTFLSKSGVAYKSGPNAQPPFPNPGTTTQLVCAALVLLNGSTDFIDIFVVCTGGGQINANAESSFFQACLLRGV